MAIIPTNRLTAGDTVAASPYTTASISPSASGDPIIAYIAHSASTVRTISSVVGLGLTWTVVKQGTGGSGLRGELWKGLGTASTGTVVITWSGTITGAIVSFVQYAGAHQTVPIVSGQTSGGVGNSATATTTLPSGITAGNAAIGGVIIDGGTAVTAGGGFTRFLANYTTPTTGGAQEYDLAPADATVDATFTSGHWDIVAAELAVAAGGGGGGPTSFMGVIPI